MKAVSRVGVGLLLAALGGCQASPDEDRFFRYEHDRWSIGDKFKAYAMDVAYDVCDIFTVNVGWGKTANGHYHASPYGYFLANWIYLNVHLTKYAELGYGNWSGMKAGMLGRGMGVWREERYDGGFSLGLIQNYSVNAVRVPTRGNSQLASRYPRRARVQHRSRPAQPLGRLRCLPLLLHPARLRRERQPVRGARRRRGLLQQLSESGRAHGSCDAVGHRNGRRE